MEITEIYKFCPRCSHELKPKEGFKKCPSCNLSLYFNPKPCVVVALINKSGEVLLAKRGIEPAKGFWDLPGGFVELNETFEENARREIKEELGIEVGHLHYIASHVEPYLFQGLIYPTLAACFIAQIPPDVHPRAADDVSEFRFFAPNAMPVNKFAFKSMHKDIAAADKFLTKNPL